jgi:capsid protein
MLLYPLNRAREPTIAPRRRTIENPGKKAKAQELVNAERALITLEERFVPALREAVFKNWIEGAAIDRCLREPRSSLCLSQAAMDAYRGKVEKFVVAP